MFKHKHMDLVPQDGFCSLRTFLCMFLLVDWGENAVNVLWEI